MLHARRRSLATALRVTAAAAALVVAHGASTTAMAQRAVRKLPPPPRPRAEQSPPDERAQLRRQVRQAWLQRVRTQLNLNDDQMRKLQQTNRKYDQQRAELLRTEREARLGMRTAMADTSGSEQARQARVSQYTDQLVQVQYRRAELLDSEQKELAGFLTPVQRAQYSAMRDQLNRRLQQLQQDSTAGGRGPGSPPIEPPSIPPAER